MGNTNTQIINQEQKCKTVDLIQDQEQKRKTEYLIQEQERKTVKFIEPIQNQEQLIKPDSDSESKSSSESESNNNSKNNSKNTLQTSYDSPLSYVNQEYNQESRKRQLSASLYETRKFKLFNKYGTDYRNILCMYTILDKYYNIDYKLLSEEKKKEIYEKILNFRTSSRFIDKKIYKNISDYNFQYLGYFYYYLGKSLKLLNETVNNTYDPDIIEEAKNTFIEYLNYLENRLEDQHDRKIWSRDSR